MREGIEDLDFDEALRVEERRLKQNRNELYQLGSMAYGYSAGSRYASLLQPYLKLFSPENFFFVFQDDLRVSCKRNLQGDLRVLGDRIVDRDNPLEQQPGCYAPLPALAQGTQATSPIQRVHQAFHTG